MLLKLADMRQPWMAAPAPEKKAVPRDPGDKKEESEAPCKSGLEAHGKKRRNGPKVTKAL